MPLTIPTVSCYQWRSSAQHSPTKAKAMEEKHKQEAQPKVGNAQDEQDWLGKVDIDAISLFLLFLFTKEDD